MKHHLKTLCAAATLALATGGAGAAPIIVSFTPSAQHVNVNDTVNITMSISGLADEILSAVDFNVRYDGSLLGPSLNIDWTGLHNALGAGYAVPAPPFQLNAFDFANGNLEWVMSAVVDDDTVAAEQADSFLMVTFSFTALADGVTQFGLGLDPDFERNFVGRDGLTLDVTVQGACVAIGQGACNRVPEPASFGLAGLALIGAGLPGWALRRRNAGLQPAR